MTNAKDEPVTVIHIDDPHKVLDEVGLTAEMEIAMRRAIDVYKKLRDKYPPGVSTEACHEMD